MSKPAMVRPDFSHRLAEGALEAGCNLALYDTVSLMAARIESTARLLAELASHNHQMDMAVALNALSADAEDIQAVVGAWCGVYSDRDKRGSREPR
jgi:hypothetical protein